MKRIISLILVMAMALMLSGCGVPEGFSENTYKLTKEAISVLNDFADDKIGAAVAVTQLDDLATSLDAEMATLTDATEKSNASDVVMNLRAIIYVINRANGKVSAMEISHIRTTADILERMLKG